MKALVYFYVLMFCCPGVPLRHVHAQTLPVKDPETLQINGATWVVDSSYHYRWLNDEWKWEPSLRKVVSERYSNASVKTRINSKWNANLEEWILYTREHLSKYEIFPNATLIDSTEEWDKINEQWINSDKSLSRYNAQERLELSISYSWDASKQKWLPFFKSEWSYSDTLIINATYLIVPPDKDWKGYTKTLNYIDPLTHKSKWVDYYDWDKTLQDWTISGRRDYSVPPYSTRYLWDNNSEAFIPISRNFIDTVNGIRKSITQIWEKSPPHWVNSSANYSIYQDSLTTIIYEIWDPNSERWFSNKKTKKFRDIDGIDKTRSFTRTLSDTLWGASFKSDKKYDSEDRLLHFDSYTWSSSRMDWKGVSKFTNFWGQFISTAVSRNALKSIVIYPNPVNDYLYFTGESLEGQQLFIRSLDGHLSIKTIHHNTIDFTDLKPGYYTISLVDHPLSPVFKCLKE